MKNCYFGSILNLTCEFCEWRLDGLDVQSHCQVTAGVMAASILVDLFPWMTWFLLGYLMLWVQSTTTVLSWLKTNCKPSLRYSVHKSLNANHNFFPPVGDMSMQFWWQTSQRLQPVTGMPGTPDSALYIQPHWSSLMKLALTIQYKSSGLMVFCTSSPTDHYLWNWL